MTPSYFRVGPKIWDQQWTSDMRYSAVYLLTNRQRRTEGIYRLPLSYMAGDLEWTTKRVTKNVDALVDDGFIRYDAAANVVLIVNALAWQFPQNDNQIKHAAKALAELPSTPLLDEFAALAATHRQPFAQRLAELLGEPFEVAVRNTPSPPLSTATATESPAVPQTSEERRGTVSESTEIALQVVGVLERGLSALTGDQHSKRPTVVEIAQAIDTHKASPDVALATAIDVRQIVTSQNKAPNIAGLFKQKLAQTSANGSHA